ncbi:MAG: hypothetical protein NC401_11530 [Ruminococcus sp.]|nr:hypothetical protein [Ruminococcus sp.]
MKAFKPKIIVVPHFNSTSKRTEIFKRIFTAQAEKLKDNENKQPAKALCICD